MVCDMQETNSNTNQNLLLWARVMAKSHWEARGGKLTVGAKGYVSNSGGMNLGIYKEKSVR